MFNAATGYWLVGGDTTRVFSASAADYVPTSDADYQAWSAANGGTPRVDTLATLLEYLTTRAPSVAERMPNYRRSVKKSVVQQRITDANKISQAFTALQANPAKFARWFAPDHPDVYYDDADANAFIVALGLDPAIILAA